MGFSVSYSKIKNYDTCPKRHQEVDLLKHFKDSGEKMAWGHEVHAALAKSCGMVGGPGPLPAPMAKYKKWVDMYAAPGLPGKLYLEQQYAITKTFQPTGWKDWNNTWFRAIVDLLRIDGPVARAVDWKTGKMLHDSRQLMMSAQAIFAHHPGVRRIYTEFVWLQDDVVTPEVFDRATIAREWPPVLEKIKVMEEAMRLNKYPTNRSGLCYRHCPVLTCPVHGKRPNERVEQYVE